MAVGYGSAAVNDQLVPLPVQSAYNPWSFGPVYTGPAFWPRHGVFNVPPVMTGGAVAGVPAGAALSNGTGGARITAPTLPTNGSATGNVHHPLRSPVWFGFGFLAVGLAMLHFIHYRR